METQTEPIEKTEEEIRTLMDEMKIEAAHILWVVCALGVEMGGFTRFFDQFDEWQDAVVLIRDRALELYERFKEATPDVQREWDWYLKVEETGEALAKEYGVAHRV